MLGKDQQQAKGGLSKADIQRIKQGSTRRGTKNQKDQHDATQKGENLFNYEGSGEETSLGEMGGSQSTQSVLTSQGDGQTVVLQKTKSARCDGPTSKAPKPVGQSNYSTLEVNKKGVGLNAAEVGQNSKKRSSPVTDRGVQF